MDGAEEIFAEACVTEPEEREAFLAAACGDDAELRLEVQRMLVDAERAESHFASRVAEVPTVDEARDEALESGVEREGDQVGPYILRQEIGEGGFGTVWMAEQREPITRMVALKVVKAGMDTKEVLARFEAERQALALMDHPNIAKVLDAGATTNGRPYFAMELVKGVPITQFCDQQKYGPRRRLELFRDVCSAVNHAHQKGIIHRDLKPSNVLVTLVSDKAVPKVIDFGIAKATQSKLTDKTLFTRYEQFLGTPVYISPEQAALSGLDVDTRSDIYSLGVMLYELLAGQPPFDAKSLLSAGYDEMRRIIREDDPPKPSTKLSESRGSEGRKRVEITPSALKGELDWIVMKALEKDRTRRYETANAFSQDIARYLQDEPVLAAAPTAAYKFRKFARRNKAGLGLAAGFSLVLLAATASSGWQAWEATTTHRKAEADRRQAEEAQMQSEEALRESDRARKEAEAAYRLVLDTFRVSGSSREGDAPTVAEVLDRAAKVVETDLVDYPDHRLKLQGAIAETYGALGRNSQASEVYEAILDHYQKAGTPAHPEALRVMAELAGRYSAAQSKDKAADLSFEAFRLAREEYGETDPLTLQAMRRSIRSQFNAGQTEGLEKKARLLVELCKEEHGPESAEYVAALHQLAHAVPREQRLPLHQEVVDLARSVLDEAHSETLHAMECLASASKGNHERVISLRREVVEGYQTLHGDDEHPSVLREMGSLVQAYKDAGLSAEANELAATRWKLCFRRLGPDHPSTANALAQLGVTPGADGERAARRFEFEQAAREKLVLATTGDVGADEFLRQAVLLLQLERPEDYAGLMAGALEQFKGTGAIARACFLAPKASWRSPELIEGILDTAAQPGSEGSSLPEHVIGMAFYRLGQHSDAERILTAALDRLATPAHRIETLAVRAMVRSTSNRREDAVADLEAAKGHYLEARFDPMYGPQDVHWYEKLAAHLALREALETVAGDSSWLPRLDGPLSSEDGRFSFLESLANLEKRFEHPNFKPQGIEALQLAAGLAYLEREDRHEELARDILPLLEKEDRVWPIDTFSKAIFLLSPQNGDIPEVQREAWKQFRRARDLGEDFENNHYLRLDRGLGAYRVRDYAEVEVALSDDSPGFSNASGSVYAYSVRAMSRWRASEEEDAKKDLKEQARRDLEEAKKRYAELDPRLDVPGWHDKVGIPHILLREALETLEGTSSWLEPLQQDALVPLAWIPARNAAQPTSIRGEKPAQVLVANTRSEAVKLRQVDSDGNLMESTEFLVAADRIHPLATEANAAWLVSDLQGEPLGSFIATQEWSRIELPPHSPWPERPANLSPRQIDLSAHYTWPLDETMRWSRNGTRNLSRLPATFEPQHGVDFDLRGAIRLESGSLRNPGRTVSEIFGLSLPTEVKGIEVRQTTPGIHFLASCQWPGSTGEVIARFRMNYEDGSSDTMDVVCGPGGVSDWASFSGGGWQGPVNAHEAKGSLAELIWKNDHPEKVIETIDFLSTESPHGAPFLVAITLEEEK